MRYIGQTCTSLEERAGYRGYNYQCCPIFWRAIQKYGWENFKVEILEEGLTFEQANEREQYWIGQLNTMAPNGYNLQPGGGNHTVHESSRQKMSENRKGKNKVCNREYQSKPVFQYTKDLEFIAEYPSTHEAERQTGIRSGNIVACCNGKYNYAGGFVWIYKGHSLPDITRFKKNPSKHKIQQFMEDGTLVAEYESTAEAARNLDCYAGCIRRCLIGEVKSYKGFVWKRVA